MGGSTLIPDHRWRGIYGGGLTDSTATKINFRIISGTMDSSVKYLNPFTKMADGDVKPCKNKGPAEKARIKMHQEE